MGMTLAEKILARCSGLPSARPGDSIMASPDLLMLHETGVAGIQRPLGQLSGGRVAPGTKAVILSDHFIPAPTVHHATSHKLTREFARKIGAAYYEIGRGGIAHQVLVEEGHARPGELIVATDAHATTYGAVGAMGLGVGVTDMSVALATGLIWLIVPPTIKVVLHGALRPGVSAKDVALSLVGRYGEDGLNYKAVEIDDRAVGWDLANRMCVANQLSEAGAKTALFYGPERASRPDDDAAYEAVVDVDLGQTVPMVAWPHSPANVRPVTESLGVKADQVFIGSCTNGRIEDLRIAAGYLPGRQVHPRVRLIVTPASQRIYRQALAEGLLEVFTAAGALVTHSTCGACVGGFLGLLADGEVCVATSNRNFRGRMGSREAGIYLVSPATAAAAAVAGEIVDPREMEGGPCC